MAVLLYPGKEHMQQGERRAEQLNEARRLWQESERVLDIQRSKSGQKLEEPSEELLWNWYQHLRHQQ